MKKSLQNFTTASFKRNLSSFFRPENNALLMFAVEGMLFAIATNIMNNNNNLFALRLGASDAEISLVASIPQFVGVIVLLPLGILTDRMKNKRMMVSLSLMALALFYLFIGFVPFLGNFAFPIFILFLCLSVGPLTGYNASWQAYFPMLYPLRTETEYLQREPEECSSLILRYLLLQVHCWLLLLALEVKLRCTRSFIGL